MSLTLTSRDLVRLQATLETLLTPIAHSSPDAWGRAVMRDVQALLSADQAFFALPLDGSVHLVGSGDRTDEAAVQYEKEYWQTDFVIGERRKALGLEVHHQDQLYKAGELERDVLFNEWCVPNKLFDTLGIAVDVSDGPIPAGVNVYHEPISPSFGERGRLLMELLAPAFKASVRSYRTMVQLGQSANRTIDAIPSGVCIFDEKGKTLFENRALAEIYRAEPDRKKLQQRVEVMARGGVCAALYDEVAVVERYHTTTTAYEVRLARCAGFLGLPGATGVVIVECLSSSDNQRRRASTRVREKFRLTARETEVALLLAKRLTTSEIATALGVSPHTARHHTENVFAKTGVSRRDCIAALFDL